MLLSNNNNLRSNSFLNTSNVRFISSGNIIDIIWNISSKNNLNLIKMEPESNYLLVEKNVILNNEKNDIICNSILPEYINSFFTSWLSAEILVISLIFYSLFTYLYFFIKFKKISIQLYLFQLNEVIKENLYLLLIFLISFCNILFFFKKRCWIKSFLYLNFFSMFIKCFIVLLSIILVYYIYIWYLQNQNFLYELYILFLGLIVFSFLFNSTNNFFLIYILLEGISLQSYVLVLLNFTSVASEVVLKYFLLGNFFSAILIYGLSLLYGSLNTLNLLIIKESTALQLLISNDVQVNNIMFKISIIFILVALLFKLGSFPVHFWVPSVYTNSPNPVMLLLATVVKTIVFFFITFLYYYIFFKFSYSIKAIFIISCIGSMLVGALGAYREMKIKNFISYASINQVGFILVGLACYTELGISFSIYYFFIYIILTLGFFNFLINIQQSFTQKNLNYFSDIKYFYKKNDLLTFLFSLYILSFAGLPPFAGFFGKLNLYFALLKSENLFLLLLILFINLISLYYYIKIIKIIWFENLSNVDKKFINYRILNDWSLKGIFIGTSFFNIFFLYIINIYENFINNLFFSFLTNIPTYFI